MCIMVAAQLMDQLVKTQAERNALRHEVADLRAQVEWFKRNLFGQGKSETFDALQTRLKFDDEVIQPEVPAAPKEQIHYERSKPTKRELPAERFKDLPVLETTELIPDAVKADPQAYERIGEESTFEVKITPPKLWKRAIVRPKFRHKLDRSQPLTVGSFKAPDR